MSKVCAVVVTYNRPELLLENIHALISQEFKLQTILIVDNYSNKDTLVKLQDGGYINHFSDNFVKFGGEIKSRVTNKQGEEIEFIVLRLSTNTGGSGGFNQGIRYFYEKTTDDLAWVMDDDTIPHNDSLNKLEHSYELLKSHGHNVGFVCSRVLEQNLSFGYPPVFYTGNELMKYYVLKNDLLRIQNCPFLSALFTRNFVKICGLPIKDFFIWLDDIEYTGRMKDAFDNAICLSSVVIHKRGVVVDEHKISQKNFFKFQNGFRNKMFLMSEDTSIFKIPKMIRQIVIDWRTIKSSDITFTNKIKLLKSLLIGSFFFRPKREYFK